MWDELRNLRRPAVVAAFSGWNDAGEAASGVIDHLAEQYETRFIAALDPQDYYDFQVNRPTVQLDEDGHRTLEWPTTEILVAALPERDLVLIGGPEPSFHWSAYADWVMTPVREAGPELVVLLGALITDAPHSRPVPVSATAGDAHLAEELGLGQSDYEGPTGILGVLADECDKAGLPAVTMWASVPHYVAEPPDPKATLALLARLEEVLNTALDSGDLLQRSETWMEQVDELVSADPDIARYIAALEERRDEEPPAPTGESIAAEFERYLNRRDRRS